MNYPLLIIKFVSCVPFQLAYRSLCLIVYIVSCWNSAENHLVEFFCGRCDCFESVIIDLASAVLYLVLTCDV